MPKISALPVATPSGNSIIPIVEGGVTGRTTVNDLSQFFYEGVNVQVEGAAGDGVTDDTAILQAIIDANPGKHIYFPSGTYIITSALTITSQNTKISGDGPSSRISQQTANTDCFRFRPTTAGTTSAFLSLTSIENIFITGYTAMVTNGGTTGAAIRMTQCASYKIFNVYYGDIPEGITIEGGQAGSIRDIWAYAANAAALGAESALLHFKQAAYSSGPTLYQPMYTTEVRGVNLSGGGKRDCCIRIANCDGLHFSQMYLNNNGGNTIIKLSQDRDDSYISDLTFSQTYVDGVGGNSTNGVLVIDDGYTAPVYHLTLDDTCHIGGCTYGLLVRKDLYTLKCSAHFSNHEKWAMDHETTGGVSTIDWRATTSNNGDGTSGDVRIAGTGRSVSLNGWTSTSAANLVLLLTGTWGRAVITGCINNTNVSDIDISGLSLTNGYCFLQGNTSAYNMGVPANSWMSSGTFTPTITFGGGSTGITYTSREGYWELVGPFVHFNICIILSSKGSSTGNAAVGTLPFACAAASANHAAALPVRLTAMTAGVFDQMVMGLIPGTATTIRLDKVAAGAGTVTQMTDADFTNTSSIMISGSYYVG